MGLPASRRWRGWRASTFPRKRLDVWRATPPTVVMRHGRAGRVLDVGRKRRTISPALRRALTTRDPECRFPGCQARHCDAHHVRGTGPAGGATRLDNLVRLCRRHHRAVHEEGFRVTLDPDGTARFCRPDGQPLPAAPPAPRWAVLPSRRRSPIWRRPASRSAPRPGAPTGTANAWTRSGRSTSSGGRDLRWTLLPMAGRVPGPGHEPLKLDGAAYEEAFASPGMLAGPAMASATGDSGGSNAGPAM